MLICKNVILIRWVVEASEKLPEQQIDDSITEIEFNEMRNFIKSKKQSVAYKSTR